MTSQTRMRISKNAAKLIHEYRDSNDHRTNTDAIFMMVADLDVGVCNERHMQRDIDNLNAELYDANRKIEDTRANLRLATSANVDLQHENLRKREQVDSLEQSLLDHSWNYEKRLEKYKEHYREKLKTRNEWLFIFAVSNVVGWGLAITALAGVM